jgi:tetratricopeptide (TPR) repeat protein
MSWELAWRWAAAGGEVPGGVGALLLVLAFWWWLLLRVIASTGALRERGPWPLGLGGSAVLLAGFLLLRTLLTPPPGEDRLAVWPFSDPIHERGYAEAAWIEEGLADAGLHPRLVPCRFLLPAGARRITGPAAADSLMDALHLRWLLTGSSGEEGLRLSLWERRWGCLRERGTREAGAGGLPRAAIALLQQSRLLGETPPMTDLPRAWLPLYAPVADSAALWLELPEGPLPLRQDLRRASLALQLGAGAARVVPALNRALAAGDSAGVEPWLLAARWFAREGDWSTAKQALANALARDAGDGRVYWLLSHLNDTSLREFGYRNRLEARARALVLQPALRGAVLIQAPLLQDLRRGDEALHLSERALAALPDDVELLLLRANLAYGLLDYPLAEQLYGELCERLPEDVRPWMNLGQLQVLLGRWEQAIPPLERAVALGSPPRLLHLLGLCHHKLGRREPAIHYLQRRLALGGEGEDLQSTRRLLASLQADGSPRETAP